MFLTLLLIQAAWGLAPFFSQVETIDRHVDGVHQRSYFVIFNEKAPVFGQNKEKLQSWLPIGLPEVHAGDVQWIYEISESFRGFSAWILPSRIDAILAYDFVKYVEEDQVMRAMAPFTQRKDWGQVRVNQKGRRNLATSPSGLYDGNTYPSGSADTSSGTNAWDWTSAVNTSYRLPNTGTNSRIYIVDTGIVINHQEFTGRIVVNQDYVTTNNTGGADCNGHGTHCAGSAAGTYRGIATGAQIGNVRVLNCQGSGTNANVVAGFNYVGQQFSASRTTILSASLGGGASSATDDAINGASRNGIVPVVAAGNDSSATNNVNACTVSPARATGAITVAASTKDDARSSFSNSGTCVNVFAPGTSIHSAYYSGSSTTSYATLSGTSMATPLTAGAIAIYGTRNVGSGFTAVLDAIKATATSGQLSSVGLANTPNLIINSQW